MSGVRSMFPLLPIAEAGPVTWPGIVFGALGSGGLVTMFTVLLNRYGVSKDAARAIVAKEKEAAVAAALKEKEGDAAVKIAGLASADKLEEAYRREIHHLIQDANGRIVNLENRAEHTEQKLERMRAKYVQLYIYAERLQDRNQALLRVIKNGNPDFDDAHFQRLDLSQLAPDSLFSSPPQAQLNITIPAEAKKTSALIRLDDKSAR